MDYGQLVDLSPDGIFLSRSNSIFFVNPAAVRLFRPERHPQIRERVRQLLMGKSVPAVEETIVGLDGTIREVEIRGTLFEDLSDRAIQVIVRDITERKRTESALRESEERLRLAFAGAQEGIWDWNLETNAVVYSSRWKQMLGYSEDEIEPHISAWERLVHPDDRAAADAAHQSVALGQPTYEAEFRLRHKDGHYIYVLSRGFPVRRDPDGPVIRIVGTHFDLTERRKREAERARTELLAHLVFVQEDERRRIARDMHDQFGEQLTALTLRIARLKDACGQNTDLTDHAQALEAIAQRLDNDVDRLVWELRPTALDDLGLRAALTNYIQEWSQRSRIAADLHTSGLLDDRLPPDVETALYRIAQEALNNAAKHSRAKHVEVILERRSDCVLLIIEDDGVGFAHAENAHEGRGFGLVGMQERAALVGATLQIESGRGKGTSILVRMAFPSSFGEVVEHARYA
jgi:two-component system, NarL family, sensor histidine kinase UhpB